MGGWSVGKTSVTSGEADAATWHDHNQSHLHGGTSLHNAHSPMFNRTGEPARLITHTTDDERFNARAKVHSTNSFNAF
ncbi:hypothetical protein [Ephemeroptericola cinctiostellae]|uniref:hypothetical protein n=1 Tax=Ephemeroptericola cinctiostellae TaxID=2268024 RepID=UPI000DF73FAE|nr:hypothetical protein [Ephemeroptericola cinctiostellae]